MKRLLLVATTLSIAGLTMMNPPLLHSQTNEAKKPVVFACNMKALTPEQRKRHSDVLSPALIPISVRRKDLSNGRGVGWE